jgi:hypothetical protein
MSTQMRGLLAGGLGELRHEPTASASGRSWTVPPSWTAPGLCWSGSRAADRRDGYRRDLDARALFVFIGARTPSPVSVGCQNGAGMYRNGSSGSW